MHFLEMIKNITKDMTVDNRFLSRHQEKRLVINYTDYNIFKRYKESIIIQPWALEQFKVPVSIEL